MNISPILSIAGWAAFGLLVLYVFYVVSMRSQGRQMRISVVVVVILLVLGIALGGLGAGLVFIEAQTRGVVISPISPGGLRGPLEPGLTLIMPFVETVITYPISNQNYTMSISPTEGAIRGDDSIEARTSDGQQVRIDASVIFRINPGKVLDVHIKWQNNYVDGIVRPAARGVIRDVASQFGVEEVYSTRRGEMIAEISERMTVTLDTQGLELVEFILRNVAFTDAYGNSIEQKQIAEQDALRAQFLVEQERQEAERVRVEAQGQRDAAITRAEGDARSTILRAQAEAEALRLVSEALAANPDLLTFRYIEKLSPTIRTVLLPSNAPFIIDIQSLLQQAQSAVPAPTPEPTPAP
jgi:regulator of protease activity HflC (stomatin/prohibitin superfamily)